MPAILKNRSYMQSGATDTASAFAAAATDGRNVQSGTYYSQQSVHQNQCDMYQSSTAQFNAAQLTGRQTCGIQSSCSPSSSQSSGFDAQLEPNGSSNSLQVHSGANGTHEYKPFSVGGLLQPEQFQSVSGALSPGAQCAICGDKATGKHYGAQSCDGCKGFFRRSVRKNQQYRCRFQRACQIDKDKRNQCRSCRLAKCLRAGMRKEAVQNERDKIGSKTQNSSDVGTSSPDEQNLFGLSTLQNAEMMSRRVCYELSNGDANGRLMNGGQSPAKSEEEFVKKAMANRRNAGASDIVDAMHRQLLVLVEWSKAIPCFMTELSLDDQITMLRAHAGDHLLIGVTKRSLGLSETLLLANGSVIVRDINTESETNRIANRVIDELVRPMQELVIDDNECACLKAIVFFDPSARGLNDSSRIRAWRHQVMLTLNDYVRERSYDPSLAISTPAGRFGELMMLIPVLQNLSMLMVDQLQLIRELGAANVNTLLQEMLCGVSCGSADRGASSETSSPSVGVQSAGFPRGTLNGGMAISPMMNSASAHVPLPMSGTSQQLHSHASSSGMSSYSLASTSNAVSMMTAHAPRSMDLSKGNREQLKE